MLALHSNEEPGIVGPAILSSLQAKKLFILAGKVENYIWTHEGCADVLSKVKSQLELQKQLTSLLAQPSIQLASTLQLPPSALCATLSQRPEALSN